MGTTVGQQLSLFGLKATDFQQGDPAQLSLDIREITERPKHFGQPNRKKAKDD